MKIPRINDTEQQLIFCDQAVELVAKKYSMNSRGKEKLLERVHHAIWSRKLPTRDTDTTLRIEPSALDDEVTPLLAISDFNNWLEEIESSDMKLEMSDLAASRGRQGPLPTAVCQTSGETKQQREDRRYREFLAEGGCAPHFTGSKWVGRWTGVTKAAEKQGIKRQTLTADLKAAAMRGRKMNYTPTTL